MASNRLLGSPVFRFIHRNVFSTYRRFADIDTLPVSEYLKSSLKGLGIHKLTCVQSDTFAPIMAGKSVIATARTGTGKTLAYLVPVVARMDNERFPAFACLVVVPTRELCQQVGSVLVALNPAANILLAYGKPSPAFATLLQQGPQVVVGTAGRIASMVKRGEIDLRKVQILVVDELDSLLMPEYRKDIHPLLAEGFRQVIGVGATMGPDLLKVLKQYKAFDSAQEVDLLGNSTNIKHFLVKVPNSLPLRASVVATLLATRSYRKCIVFVKNSDEAKSVSHHPNLSNRVKVLHGDLQQTERDKVLNAFRVEKGWILVCTDLAARGIDVPEIDLVLSLAPPSDGVAYCHRAGRTGRGVSSGDSVLLYSANDEPTVDKIKQEANLQFQQMPCPSKEQQRVTALELLVTTCCEQTVSDKLTNYSLNLLSEFPGDAARLTATCIRALLGSVVDTSPPKFSVLSGELGFIPVLFVDPGKVQIQSRADLQAIIDSLGLRSTGAIALSESGYIADFSTSDASKVCYGQRDFILEKFGVEPALIDQLPMLVSDQASRGKKFDSILPWRRRRRPTKRQDTL